MVRTYLIAVSSVLPRSGVMDVMNSDSMDDSDDLPEASSLDEQAIDWVVRLTSGTASEAECVAFEQWRTQSEEHRVAAQHARQLWGGVGGAMRQHVPYIRAGTASAQRPRRTLRVLAIAASVILGIALGFQLLHRWQYDYVTATAEQQALSLPDGSQITLNTGTALNVNFSAATRSVSLARGEAYFDVTHDTSRPFIVRAGSAQVRVVGTAFSVRLAGDRVIVTVERGRVEVTDAGVSVLLTRDQRVVVGGGVSAEVEAIDSGAQLAWRRGRLIIEDQPLSDVLDELQRYRTGFIVVRNPQAGARRLNAVIDLQHIDAWLIALQQSQPVAIRQYGPLAVVE